MITKKIIKMLFIMFVVSIFAVPAFAGVDATTPVFWWDVNEDMMPDTEVFLSSGDTLNANLYISGLVGGLGCTWMEMNINYASPEMFNDPDINDSHLHLDFENLRMETAAPGQFYQRGGYLLGYNLTGNDKPILGEYDVMGVPGLYFPGISLTATDYITEDANILLEIEEIIFGDYGNPLPVDMDTYALTINPVPIPGAVWLLGSGLLGLIGIKRKSS